LAVVVVVVFLRKRGELGWAHYWVSLVAVFLSVVVVVVVVAVVVVRQTSFEKLARWVNCVAAFVVAVVRQR